MKRFSILIPALCAASCVVDVTGSISTSSGAGGGRESGVTVAASTDVASSSTGGSCENLDTCAACFLCASADESVCPRELATCRSDAECSKTLDCDALCPLGDTMCYAKCSSAAGDDAQGILRQLIRCVYCGTCDEQCLGHPADCQP